VAIPTVKRAMNARFETGANHDRWGMDLVATGEESSDNVRMSFDNLALSKAGRSEAGSLFASEESKRDQPHASNNSDTIATTGMERIATEGMDEPPAADLLSVTHAKLSVLHDKMKETEAQNPSDLFQRLGSTLDAVTVFNSSIPINEDDGHNSAPHSGLFTIDNMASTIRTTTNFPRTPNRQITVGISAAPSTKLDVPLALAQGSGENRMIEKSQNSKIKNTVHKVKAPALISEAKELMPGVSWHPPPPARIPTKVDRADLPNHGMSPNPNKVIETGVKVRSSSPIKELHQRLRNSPSVSPQRPESPLRERLNTLKERMSICDEELKGTAAVASLVDAQQLPLLGDTDMDSKGVVASSSSLQLAGEQP